MVTVYYIKKGSAQHNPSDAGRTRSLLFWSKLTRCSARVRAPSACTQPIFQALAVSLVLATRLTGLLYFHFVLVVPCKTCQRETGRMGLHEG